MTETEKYADKIAKLLRKAESTEVEAEAEAFTAKAQQLMTTYAIDEAMLAEARGVQKEKEEIVEHRIEYRGVYQLAHEEIGTSIATANSCRCLYSSNNYYDKHQTLHIIGFESDVARVELLNSSLQIQAQAALNRWWKENKEEYGWQTQWEKTKARRSFLFGFASGLSVKLQTARRAGEEEATRREAEREQVSEEKAGESVALVLRSRKDQVNDWVDNAYGKLKTRSSRYDSYSGGGNSAGRQAGMRADISGGIGGGKGGQLNA